MGSADLPRDTTDGARNLGWGAKVRALFGEARERTRRRRLRQLWVFVVLCATATAVGFALHGGGGPSRRPGRVAARGGSPAVVTVASQSAVTRPGPPLGSVPSRAQLEANFGILRRRQTAADRGYTPVCSCAHSPEPSTRLAARLPGDYRVFVDLESYAGAVNFPDLVLYIVSPNGNTSGEGIDAGNYLVSPTFWGVRNSNNVKLFAGVVPDGVASVSWTFRTKTYVVPVVDNLAAREIAGDWNCDGCSSPTKVVWRAADGRVISAFSGYGNLPAPPFLAGRLGVGTRRILAGTGIGTVHLGESFAGATRTLTHLLGSAAYSDARVAGCGIDHETVWTSPAVADPLTVYAHDGRFVGYRYGALISSIGLTRGPGAVLATREGVTISEHFGAVERTYPHGVSTRMMAHVGGAWSATTTSGTLHGFVLADTYPFRSVAAKNLLATIGAGDTGCVPQR